VVQKLGVCTIWIWLNTMQCILPCIKIKHAEGYMS
jgi:hypothetical protein